VESSFYVEMGWRCLGEGIMPRGRIKGATARYPHGKSIKNPATYEALKRKGMSKTKAARISNAALRRGFKKGRRGRKK
jgi:hypothetical protein